MYKSFLTGADKSVETATENNDKSEGKIAALSKRENRKLRKQEIISSLESVSDLDTIVNLLEEITNDDDSIRQYRESRSIKVITDLIKREFFKDKLLHDKELKEKICALLYEAGRFDDGNVVKLLELDKEHSLFQPLQALEIIMTHLYIDKVLPNANNGRHEEIFSLLNNNLIKGIMEAFATENFFKVLQILIGDDKQAASFLLSSDTFKEFLQSFCEQDTSINQAIEFINDISEIFKEHSEIKAKVDCLMELIKAIKPKEPAAPSASIPKEDFRKRNLRLYKSFQINDPLKLRKKYIRETLERVNDEIRQEANDETEQGISALHTRKVKFKFFESSDTDLPNTEDNSRNNTNDDSGYGSGAEDCKSPGCP